MTRVRHNEDMSTQQSAPRIPALTMGWRLKMALDDDSAQAMADYLGVSRQTISRWMADKGSPPKRAYLAQWALRTGVPVEWLERGTGPNHGDDGGGEGASTLVRSKGGRRHVHVSHIETGARLARAS